TVQGSSLYSELFSSPKLNTRCQRKPTTIRSRIWRTARRNRRAKCHSKKKTIPPSSKIGCSTSKEPRFFRVSLVFMHPTAELIVYIPATIFDRRQQQTFILALVYCLAPRFILTRSTIRVLVLA